MVVELGALPSSFWDTQRKIEQQRQVEAVAAQPWYVKYQWPLIIGGAIAATVILYKVVK